MKEGQVVLVDASRTALHHVKPEKRGGNLTAMPNLPLRWHSRCGVNGVVLLFVGTEMKDVPVCEQCVLSERLAVGRRVRNDRRVAA